MKKINIILITLVLIFSGCTEFLTLEPQDELIREEYWKSKGDVENLLGQAYAKLAYTLDEVYLWTELRGGLFSPGNKVNPETLEFFNFSVNEFNKKTQWGDFYVVINLANTIIEYAPLAKDNDKTFSELAYNGYIAEAYFIRTLCYFYLVKSFKEVPFITQSYSKDDQDFNFEKSGEQEIIDLLITDMNSIVDKAHQADFFNSNAKRKGRVTKDAVYALLADIYLWNNDYQSCIETCNKVSDTYGLVEGDQYFSIYSAGNSSESIFELQFDYDQYRTTNTYGKDLNLYTLTSNNPRGIRIAKISEYSIGLFSLSDYRQNNDLGNVTYHPTILSLWKYEGLSPIDIDDKTPRNDRDFYRSDANFIFYRFPDIHLMKAEAYAELDDFNNSLIQLNIVKNRAGTLQYTNNSNKLSLLSEILDERAREFIGEGKRWFDLVRVTRRDIDKRLSMLSNAVMSNVDPRNRSAVVSKIRDIDSWFLPIYYTELQLNKKLEQNPFYE